MVVIVKPLVLIMKEKVEELSNLGLKVFAIVARDEEVFAEDDRDTIYHLAIIRSANVLEFVAQD